MLGRVVVLINNTSLRFAEPNEIDDVAENLDESWSRRSVEVGEGEVFDTTFEQELAHRDEEAHEFARIWSEDAVCVVAVHLF